MALKGHTMRKFIIPLLLASVAASPVMAQDRSDREERRARASEEREERNKAREERQQQVREERQQPAEEHHQKQAVKPALVEPARPDRGNNPAAVQQPADQQRGDRQRGERRGERQQSEGQPVERQQIERLRHDRRPGQATGQAAAQAPGRDARERVDARRQQWDRQRAERIARQERIRNSRPPVISPTPQPGTQPPPPVNVRPVTNPPVRWSGNHWRNDRRYNWYKHRNKYWWLFQLGWYNDPFGWGYQPYGIGWRMWPSYYSSHYWLSDPWQYRLPYAPAGTRWIRYWDDAVLVDLWSGQVIDVVYNFFW
jgi:hypothetical protein